MLLGPTAAVASKKPGRAKKKAKAKTKAPASTQTFKNFKDPKLLSKWMNLNQILLIKHSVLNGYVLLILAAEPPPYSCFKPPVELFCKYHGTEPPLPYLIK